MYIISCYKTPNCLYMYDKPVITSWQQHPCILPDKTGLAITKVTRLFHVEDYRYCLIPMKRRGP